MESQVAQHETFNAQIVAAVSHLCHQRLAIAQVDAQYLADHAPGQRLRCQDGPPGYFFDFLLDFCAHRCLDR